MSPRLSRLLALGLLTLLPSMAAQAADPPRTQAREAVRVLSEMIDDAPDKSLPADLLKNARAIAVIPGMVKGGFVFSGAKGEGLISIKTRDGTWSNPNFISTAAAGVGFQAGIQSTDVILVFRTDRGVDSIIDGKFTMGASASAAAGPVGRSATAATDGQMKAEIYTYSRSKGLFAGIALDGARISIDDDSNEEIYGPGITPRRIFEGGVTNVPSEVVEFRDKLEEYTNR
ncbi:lipid-binding SYLF domain-containing protein [Luteibacter jiangsuensis]|uniref:Lipid-binding SYLF domain-containing protein n=1 Tax=Luteibacter jiangsuensis TaxID=637577 RepID=A0ABT9SXE2_9GAMM|nr:lipid-binding SYLF domain-containing protein [Luteibacter jiangsuensis]MDQ0009675.1 lipid-binding SYLF domain-containing protein [Luteibacter jiangsuensis]